MIKNFPFEFKIAENKREIGKKQGKQEGKREETREIEGKQKGKRRITILQINLNGRFFY